MLEKDKLTNSDIADIAVMTAMGFKSREIADSLGITEQAVGYWQQKFRERAVEIGNPRWAFAEVLLRAGPAYPIFNVPNSLRGEI